MALPPRTVLPVNGIQTQEDVEVFGTNPINVLGDQSDLATTSFIQNLVETNLSQLTGGSLQSWENFFYTAYPKEFDWDTSGAFPRAADLEAVLQMMVEEGVVPIIEGLPELI